MARDITERYVFRHLALIDMERALRSLSLRQRYRNGDVRAALLRDAVVSYAKPFSGNRGLKTKRGLSLDEKGIPKSLRAKHKEIVECRNQLFAHLDLDRQKPKLDKNVGFTVAGYERVNAEHLVEPLKRLAKAVHSHLLNELFAMKESHA